MRRFASPVCFGLRMFRYFVQNRTKILSTSVVWYKKVYSIHHFFSVVPVLGQQMALYAIVQPGHITESGSHIPTVQDLIQLLPEHI